MRFCDDHWTRLRAAIDERGMSDLVAGSGERAVKNAVLELEHGKATVATFDPLMGAHWAIVNRVMDKLGLAVIQNDGCPLCLARDQHAATCPGLPECSVDDQWFEDWIPSVADAMRDQWERLKTEEAAA